LSTAYFVREVCSAKAAETLTCFRERENGCEIGLFIMSKKGYRNA
jgi:hypothetical protein